MNLKLKRYIGDGVYAGFDGYQIWLWCDRYGQKHEIALEPSVSTALTKYITDLKLALRDPTSYEQSANLDREEL